MLKHGWGRGKKLLTGIVAILPNPLDSADRLILRHAGRLTRFLQQAAREGADFVVELGVEPAMVSVSASASASATSSSNHSDPKPHHPSFLAKLQVRKKTHHLKHVATL